MTIGFVPEQQPGNRPRITVFGIGGAGSNAVNNMIEGKLEGVEFVVANTDAQSLFQSQCEHRLRLGANLTDGLGAGAQAEVGMRAAEEAIDEIHSCLQGNNMVFITAGMGGGTGTGAAPVIASAAKESGILTVGVVTKPFHFEGGQRMRVAERGIQELQQHVDTLIVIPNQNLFSVVGRETTFADAFSMADNVLHAGVRGVTDLMVNPGLINLDFADIRTVMSKMGKAMMGTGEAEGDARATEAAEAAINNPLLDNASIEGARGVLINVTGGTDITLHEMDTAASRIREEVDEDATIIFGTSLDQKMNGHMRVAVIATGIDADEARAPIPQPEPSDNIHVLGFSDRKGADSGGALSATEARNESTDPAATPSAAGTEETDIVIPVAEPVAAAAGPAARHALAAPPPKGKASAEAWPTPERKVVTASAAGAVAARATVAASGAKTARPAPRRAAPEARAPDRGVSPPPDRPASPPQHAGGDDAPPGRPSLFERVTGTGRARRNGHDSDAQAVGAKPQAATSPLAGSWEPQAGSKDAAPRRPQSPTPDAAAPQLGGGAPKAAPPTPEPFLDGFSPSARAPGDTADPLDIPAFLRRQAN